MLVAFRHMDVAPLPTPPNKFSGSATGYSIELILTHTSIFNTFISRVSLAVEIFVREKATTHRRGLILDSSHVRRRHYHYPYLGSSLNLNH